ncbi:MAG: T9SS type A sorting domain-containing protein [Saprospiraceae bacterium]|nr:T9SS type A sorting domain-containing protein [Saprospiraceae bacterium]
MKMKITLFLWLCPALWNHLYSQQTALFQAVIRFEDAVGNKDSVTVGYDPNATFGIDAEFGEAEITAPFDSVFEVRAMSAISFNNTFSKVIIEYSQFIPAFNCHGGPRTNIFVWSKYQPVKVSWDSTIFLNERCLRGSFISNHEIDELTGPFEVDEFPPVCACMASQDSYVFELTQEALIAHYDSIGYDESVAVGIEAEIEGVGNQTIYGLRFKPDWIFGYTPCYWITDVEEPTAAIPLSIFPNPSHGLVKIAGPEYAAFDELKVFDATGHLVHSIAKLKNSEADLSGLPGGIYQLQAQSEDGKRYMGRVVKL